LFYNYNYTIYTNFKLIRKITPEESHNLIIRLYGEANYLKKKKEKAYEEYMGKTCTFSPQINNREEPKPENFFNRLQEWMEQKLDKTNK